MIKPPSVPIDLQAIAEFHWRIENAGIRQESLLAPSRLGTLANQCNLTPGLSTHIIDLWQAGCLRADLVVAKVPPPPGFCLLDDGDGEQRVYGDVRNPELNVAESGRSFLQPQFDANGMEPYFHPFRLFVLYELRQISLYGVDGLLPECRTVDEDDEKSSWFRGWLGKDETAARIERINQIAGLAAISDPCGLPDVREAVYKTGFLSLDEVEKRIDAYRSDLYSLYRQTGLGPIRKAHGELCVAANRQNPDWNVRAIVRLMTSLHRKQLRGPVAGSYRIHELAETIRRVAEGAFEQTLPEEDETGNGGVFPGYKIDTFGTNRLLDGSMKAKGAFLRSVGLDYRHCANLYVEGATEVGAMDALFTGPGIVAVKNLAGQIVEKRRKGLAFRESLEDDLETSTFSFVLLDGDVSDNARALKVAARDDKICGAFLISTPDFELGNFALDELAEIAAGLLANSASPPSADQIFNAIQGATSARELETVFSEFGNLRKGSRWGEALIDYALNNPKWNPAGASEAETRPIIEFVGWITLAPGASYRTSRNEFRVAPDTGRPEKRA